VRGRRRDRFASRCAESVLALALLLTTVPAPTFAAQAPQGLTMRWAAEGMFLGDLGATKKTVTRDAGSLRYTQGRWQGTLGYTDVLGIFDGNSVISQVAVVDLRFEGASSAVSDAAGTFSGTVTLYTRPAGSLAEAAAPEQAREAGGLTSVYDIAGTWSARVSGSRAIGTLTFNSLGARRGGTGPIRGLDWFTPPASEVSTTGPREGHPLALSVEGPVPQGARTTTPGASTGATGAPSASRSQLGFFDFVRRGIAGVPETVPPPVAPELQRRAQFLVASKPLGAMALPANALATDIGVPGALLDVKNVAFGLASSSPRSTAATNGVGTSQERGFAIARGQLTTAPDSGSSSRRGMAHLDARRVRRGRHPVIVEAVVPALASELASRGVPGARELAEDLRGVPANPDEVVRARLGLYLSALQALVLPTLAVKASGVLEPTAFTARSIHESTLDLASTQAGPVLAAAGSPRAPLAATEVAAFAREKSLDASAPVAAAAEFAQAAPYAAYRRSADRAVFWLAASRDFALRDGSLVGWGWSASGVAVVDARDAGVWRAFVDTTRPRPAGR
jgi:hypothetical protein